MRKDCTQNGPEAPKNPEDSAADSATLSSLFALTAALVTAVRTQHPVKGTGRKSSGRTHVPWKLSNPRGRKGAPQGARRLQASDRREVRHAVLHHESGRQGSTDLSVRRLASHRTETAQASQLQSHEKEVPQPHELLRTTSGDGRAGPVAHPESSAGGGRDQGRGGGTGSPHTPRSAEHPSLPCRDGAGAVHR